ncbi:PREDICTED: alpha-tocopherol transfer protein-like [Dinoponera quadriceps]|uniref:Alpha-tocopherol transfer protein-like n=1 Tax=Dinoponera quadriceps TaxID=609295 RepID=A0A6P3XYB7_DINQU|nr:PREDICTED: alpha-tocopherol transfer protein-like [Dinoponera quadriceps]
MSSIMRITLEEELKKNPELKLSDIQILREWCEKQPHLPKIQDVELAIFLHSSYYHIESTKKRIENYYTYRSHAPELFSNRDIRNVKQLRDAFKVTAYFKLEGKTKEEYCIFFSRMVDMDPSHFFLSDSLKACLMSIDELFWTRESLAEYIMVIDVTGYTTGHVGRTNLVTLKKMIYYCQDALPVRLKGVHIINSSPIFEMIFNMAKHFINEEMINLVYVHSSLENVNKYIPIKILPNECGGKAGPIQELWKTQLQKIENFHEWFLEDEKNHRVNESLRIGNSKTSSDLFGVEGSFRQVEID